ncbi:MAG: DUF1153 domain-containing protein [Pseudomonadota bacterium]
MAYPSDISIAEAIKQYGLPKSHRIHWSKSKKADVVRAVRDEIISFAEARDRYLLSRKEFEQWELDLGGTPQPVQRSRSLEDA